MHPTSERSTSFPFLIVFDHIHTTIATLYPQTCEQIRVLRMIIPVTFVCSIQVYYSEDIIDIPVDMIEGKCEVRKKNDLPSSDLPVMFEHVFFCELIYDRATGALKQVSCIKSLF